MASIAKQCFLLFLLTLLFSLQIHARDSQFFNKVPSNNGEKETEIVVPDNEETVKNKQEQEQEPNFVPENENGGYGLYGHETGQFPPTTTTTATNPTNDETYKTTTTLPYNGEPRESYPKYLPKNYNTESYVTEPEGYRGEFDNNKNTNFYNGDNSYYNNEQQGLGETKLMGKSYSTNPNNNGNYNNNNKYGNYYNNNYGNSNSYYNGEQQGLSDTRFNSNSYYHGEQNGLSDTRFNNNNNYYKHNVGNLKGVQKQGMSDTRFLENGKYFHDISLEQQNFNRGPYESTNNRGFYGNPENSYDFNNYQNQEQFQNFQDEEDLP